MALDGTILFKPRYIKGLADVSYNFFMALLTALHGTFKNRLLFMDYCI